MSSHTTKSQWYPLSSLGEGVGEDAVVTVTVQGKRTGRIEEVKFNTARFVKADIAVTTEEVYDDPYRDNVLRVPRILDQTVHFVLELDASANEEGQILTLTRPVEDARLF